MTEEMVTKFILKNLIDNDWDIVCFDFPQSGTGKFLHPDTLEKSKNQGSINPDIVAVKKNICLFFENKDRFYKNDFIKVNRLINNNIYKRSISKLLENYIIDSIFYGIGLPRSEISEEKQKFNYLVDFIIGVNINQTVEFVYNVHNLEL